MGADIACISVEGYSFTWNGSRQPKGKKLKVHTRRNLNYQVCPPIEYEREKGGLGERGDG